MDVGTVFAGARLEEDNVFFQAMSSGKRVAAVGDDTWEQLFPTHSKIALNISKPFPSLNVKDLHTVDDGVAKVWGSVSLSSAMYLHDCSNQLWPRFYPHVISTS